MSYHIEVEPCRAKHEINVHYLEPAIMNCWRSLLSETPLLYRTIHQNRGYLGQLNCRTSYHYLQTYVRWFSTRKDARVVLLRQNQDTMKKPRVILVGNDSKKIGEMSPKDAFELGKRQGMEVAIVNLPSGRGEMATCKLISKQQIKGENYKSKQKIIECKANIAEHDLQTKIKKINELLGKGNFVCVNVLSRKKKEPVGISQKRLLEQICKQVYGMAGKISVKATMVSCVIKPPENEENKMI